MIYEDPKTRFVYSTEGYWLPPICKKQYEVFVDGHRYLLISGPRMSGKSEAIYHKVLKHAYDNPGARVAVFTITSRAGKSGGPWQDLTTRVLDIWRKAPIGFKVTQEPKVTGDTRQNMFKIQSRFGKESEILLHSLEFAPEVNEKLRGTKWSLIWFSEIDQIAPLSGPEPEIRDDREVFAAASAQLRMEPEIEYNAHQIIMDCNPPEDGEDHWLFRVFEVERHDERREKAYRDRVEHIRFTIDDNPFLSSEIKSDLYNQYSYRKSLLDRLYYGLWTRESTKGHFGEMFKSDVHVLGDINKPDGEKETIVPTDGCKLLITGLDLGDKNHGFIVLEKLEVKDETGRVVTKFSILDELVIHNREVPLSWMVGGMMEMVTKWEKYCKDNYGRDITWRHWSDEAAFKHFRSAAEAMDYLLVRNYSAGKINLRPAPKYRGSIRDRVQLLQQLMFENRIYFSAQLEECLTMLRVLRKGKTVADYVYPPKYVHVFDALTYALQSEAPVDEIEFSDVKTDKAPRRLVLAG